MKSLAEQSHYEMLELAPGATLDQIERAYAKAKETYGPGSLATYALAEPGETDAVLRRLDEARGVLADPEKRKAYDAEHGFPLAPAPPEDSLSRAVTDPGDEPAQSEKTLPPNAPEKPEEPAAAAPPSVPEPAPAIAAPVEDAVEPKPPAPSPSSLSPPPSQTSFVGDKPVRKTESELPPDAPVTGEALKRVREARGLTLKDLETKTKIGHWHLEAIEREKWTEFPAQVYLRGFLMSLARELKLDPVRVSKSYLEQIKGKQTVKP